MTLAVLKEHDRIETLMNEVCEEYRAAGLLTRAVRRTPVVNASRPQAARRSIGCSRKGRHLGCRVASRPRSDR